MLSFVSILFACVTIESTKVPEDDTSLQVDTAVDTVDTQEGDRVDTAEGSTEDSDDDNGGETDTADAVETYRCDVLDFGYCVEGVVSQGWHFQTASEVCDLIAESEGKSTSLAAGGCDTTSVVGTCMLIGYYEGITISGWYDSSTWEQSDAMVHCDGQGGAFFTQ